MCHVDSRYLGGEVDVNLPVQPTREGIVLVPPAVGEPPPLG